MLNEGDKVPALKTKLSAGTALDLASPGGPLVLYFYPKDDTSGCTKEAQDFTTLAGDFEKAGVKVVGLSRDPMKKHEKFIAKYELKVPLASDEDWEAATRLQVTVASERLPNAGVFLRHQMARYRRFTREGRGQWFGAFDGGALVADLGVFVEEGVARYQAVETAPSHRGGGICGTLVHEAGRRARAELGAERLVMVADPEGRAARVYESVGFQETERLVALWLTPDRVDERGLRR